ncbi:MAG: hypothetical protein ACM3JB_08635 [Acidobacteriaceae bacterium]
MGWTRKDIRYWERNWVIEQSLWGGEMSATALRALCCVVLAIFPASLMLADADAAMVMASGAATLNGTALAHSTAIFSGDLLETGPNSALTITSNGSTVLMGANARLHYFGDSVQLHLGSTQVSTSKGMKIESDTVTIEPNKNSAKYRVNREQHTITIAALAEELRVDNNGESTVLPPGGSLTLQEKGDDQTASPVGGPSNRRIFTVAGAAVGGTAAVVWMKNDTKTPISNQIP